MKSRNIFTALALAALVFTACNRDAADPNTDRVKPEITSSINGDTKATNDQWADGDKVGIYMVAAGTATISEGADNVEFTATADGKLATTAEKTFYFPTSGSNVDFFAYYPFAATVANYVYKVDVSDQSSQQAIDLLYAKATGKNKDNREVALTFTHQLSKVTFVVSAGVGLTEADLAELKIEMAGMNTKADFNVSTGVLGASEAPLAIVAAVAANGKNGEAIILPDAAREGRRFNFTLKATDETFSWIVPDTKEFKAGEKTVYNVTLDRTSIGGGVDGNITSTIVPWKKGNGDDGEIIDIQE